MYTYKIHLHKGPEGGYTVSVPVLPGSISDGEDVHEAITMAKGAIELYVEDLQERSETFPNDSNTLKYSLNLNLRHQLRQIAHLSLKSPPMELYTVGYCHNNLFRLWRRFLLHKFYIQFNFYVLSYR